MLTGNLVRVKIDLEAAGDPAVPRPRRRHWLEAAESLLLLFREGAGMTRGEIEAEIDELFGGGGKATQVHRGLAKVLEDRAEFEVVADVPPETVREKVFTRGGRVSPAARAARAPPATARRSAATRSSSAVARELELEPEAVARRRSSPTSATRTACCGSRTSRPSG